MGNNSAMYTTLIKSFINLRSLFIIGFLFFSLNSFAQSKRVKSDSIYLNNFQIELTADKNYIFISKEGIVDIPFDSIRNLTKISIVDFDNNTSFFLFPEELKFKDGDIVVSSGKLIDPITIKKKQEQSIGIEHKGGSSKHFIRSNSSRILEIPNVNKQYQGRKIKKLRYYFTGGNNTLYDIKTLKKDIRIIPILFTCESVDCKNRKILIPEMEIRFLDNSKFLEVDLRQHDIFIDNTFQNLYVGYIALNYFVVKEKKVEKIAPIKCYNNFPELNATRINTHKCPIITVVLE